MAFGFYYIGSLCATAEKGIRAPHIDWFWFSVPIGSQWLSVPILRKTDLVYVLKNKSKILRAPFSKERMLDPPMAMVFHDQAYACEFHHQFNPTAQLEEV